jgi:anthranilate phosphoribosyltransferase
VVHGSDGLDELTTTGASYVAELKDGRVTTFEITPEDAGLTRATPDALKGGDPMINAAALRELLGGKSGAYRDIVLLNAAASLMVAGKAKDLKAGVALASEAIASGRAESTLGKLAATSQRPAVAATVSA